MSAALLCDENGNRSLVAGTCGQEPVVAKALRQTLNQSGRARAFGDASVITSRFEARLRPALDSPITRTVPLIAAADRRSTRRTGTGIARYISRVCRTPRPARRRDADLAREPLNRPRVRYTRSAAVPGPVTAEPTVFASNLLTIVVKPGNPKKVKGLADLPNLSTVSLCGETVPCGKYADQILTQAGVTIPPDKITRGADVKATLSTVTTGDAGAAIVYVSDAKAAGSSVVAVPIPVWQNAYAIYPIAPIAATKSLSLANAWIQYTVSACRTADTAELRVPTTAPAE
jgi:hypothetical protein